MTTREICIVQDDRSKGQQFAQQTVGRINFSTDKEQSVQSADLVVEAIIENLKIKQDLFAALDAVSNLNIKFRQHETHPLFHLICHKDTKSSCWYLLQNVYQTNMKI